MTTEKSEFCIRRWEIINHYVKIAGKYMPVALFVKVLKKNSEIYVYKDVAFVPLVNDKKVSSGDDCSHVYELAFVRVSGDHVSLWVKGDTPMPNGTVLATAISGTVEHNGDIDAALMCDVNDIYFYVCPKHLLQNATTPSELRDALTGELSRLIQYLQHETKYPMLAEGEEHTLFTPFINTSEPSDEDLRFIETVGGGVRIESIVRNILSFARGTLLTDDCQIVPAAINALHRSGFETSYITHRRHSTRVLVLYIHTGFGRILIYADAEAIKNCYDVTFEKAHNKAPKDFNVGGFIDRLLRWLNK